jgi:hypothetical protein
MPNKRSRALRRWMSRKRSFRRRWPVYLSMALICVTSAAVVILIMMSDIDAPSQTKAPQQTNVPRAIR